VLAKRSAVQTALDLFQAHDSTLAELVDALVLARFPPRVKVTDSNDLAPSVWTD